MRDGRGDLVGGRFDAEEFDQVTDDFFGVRHQFGEFDAEHGNAGVGFDECVTMFEQTSLQLFTFRVARGEPLATMFFTAVFQ